MYITTVIPISRGITKDTLTYFTKEEVQRGCIISIPLRKRTIHGLVIDIKNVVESKTEIKSLPYSIKKVTKGETRKILLESQIKSLEYLADYYATSIGAILYNLLPVEILDIKNLPDIKEEEPKENSHEVVLLQSSNEERYATYKSLIREEFARNRSVLFCLPSIEDIKNAKNILEKGIETYTFVLHSKLTKKESEKTWSEIMKNEHPVLVIVTGTNLFVPKSDIGTIIIDKESSRLYKMQTRPFLDIRKVAEIIAKKGGKKLVLGDIMLRSETLWQERNGYYNALSPLKFRSLSPANTEKISMKIPKDVEKKEFVIISDKLKEVLRNSISNNEHTFLFCGRKGMYPETICSDCGTIVTCENCRAPVVLYGRRSEREATNLFVCHHCGERREADVLCKNCGGWRLSTFGIGTEKVYDEVKKIFPDANIQILDKENIKTHKQAIKTRDNFYGTPGSILIGTEMSVSYLNKEVENIGIVSMDSFFSIPDFRINEKIFHILIELREITQKNFFIQTRKDNTQLFDYALKGNLIDFYKDEIKERKELGYPPFTTFIKLTLEGPRITIKKYMDEVVFFLKPYEVSVFEAFKPKKTGTHTLHGLITLENDRWVDPELLLKLKQLPPFVMVKIDPDTLL